MMSSQNAATAALNTDAEDISILRLGAAFLGFLASTIVTSAVMLLLSGL